MVLSGYTELAGTIFEVAGIVSMIGGAVFSVAFVPWDWREGRGPTYRRFRQRLGRTILLGLEFLVAADILRTVSEIPTLEQVGVLAIIVLIRTFLSFTLETELEGRWPWEGHRVDRPEG